MKTENTYIFFYKGNWERFIFNKKMNDDEIIKNIYYQFYLEKKE